MYLEEASETMLKYALFQELLQKEIYEENKNLKESVNELKDFREQVEQRFTQQESPKEQKSPDWLQEGFGENENIQKKFQEYEKTLEDRIVTRLYNETRETQLRQEQATKKADEFISSQLQTLKDEGKTFDRNELLKVAMDFRPSDEQGNIDLHRAYSIMETMRPKDQEKSKARKEIADQTTSSSKGESSPKDYVTSNDLRHTSWTRLVNNN